MASSKQSAPSTPEDLMARFREHVHGRNLDGLLSLYDEQAIFVPQPGVVHADAAAIRNALGQLLSLSPEMETRVTEVHIAGDIALVIVEWSLRGTGPDQRVVTQAGKSADVLRRQADGTWRVLIDHP